MVEQLNLFGERDLFQEVCDWIVKRYDSAKHISIRTGSSFPNFDKWLLDCFSSYMGSNCNAPCGYSFYQFSSKGLLLEDLHQIVPRKDGKGTEYKSMLFPKSRILKEFRIKDDNKDSLKED